MFQTTNQILSAPCLADEPLGSEPLVGALRDGQLAELVEARQDDLLRPVVWTLRCRGVMGIWYDMILDIQYGYI